MVLDGISALEQFDVGGGCVDLLGQLRLGHLVGPLLAAAVPDVGSDFRPGFLHGHDIVRPVDFRQPLSVGAGFVDLEGRDGSVELGCLQDGVKGVWDRWVVENSVRRAGDR